MPDPGTPNIFRAFAEGLRNDWRGSLARPEQLAPPGDWTTWVFCGGRGAGKTRSGAEWVHERVATGSRRIHLVAPTAADCRDVLVEGPAGLEATGAPHLRPKYSPSLRKVEWPNGAIALLFSGDEADRLRGPQCDTLWVDELCAFRQPQQVLDMAFLGLRLSKDPRCLITTTPRPIKAFKTLLARDGEDVAVSRCSTLANSENLPKIFLDQILGRFEGTRLGRQEIYAEMLEDVLGALWQLSRIDELRVREAPQLTRIVVAIDPAVSTGEDSDETGIVVAGIGQDNHGYVLEDLSGKYSPTEWARRAVAAYHIHKADRIVAEVNQGGDMVESTLRAIDPNVPYRGVHASRGKAIRAEPISALYEKGVVHHVGSFSKLEDQLTSFTPDSRRSSGSPDRADALVYALTDLLGGGNSVEGWIAFFRQQHARDQALSLPRPLVADSLPGHAKPGPEVDEGDLYRQYKEGMAETMASLPGNNCGHCHQPLEPGGAYVMQGDNYHAKCYAERTKH
jgi:phage terminase large subunit-like protein